MQEVKIALLGDSITEGLGSKKINYERSLFNHINNGQIKYSIKNFGVSGTTIQYYFQIQEQLNDYNPDIVLIFYGNVEAIYRPIINKKSLIYKLMPKKHKKHFSMIDPRPFYSRKIIKKVFQKMDSLYRFCLKRYFIKKYGTYQILEINVFKEIYEKVLSELVSNKKKIFCVSTVRIDDYYFPESSKALGEYRDVIKNLSENFNCQYINLYDWQLKFSWPEIFGDDHFHPNEKGYELIGEFFANQINKE